MRHFLKNFHEQFERYSVELFKHYNLCVFSVRFPRYAESVNIFCILEVTVMYDTILESEQKSKVFYDTFNVPWTNIKILVQNGPKYFLLKNEFYLTGNHWGNIKNKNKMKNNYFQNFIVVTVYKNINIF